MSDERRRILDMLSAGKIDASEAENLLKAIDAPGNGHETRFQNTDCEESERVAPKRKPTFLRVIVEPSEQKAGGDRVNIRVPLAMIRAGVKLNSLLPGDAKIYVADALDSKGVHLDMSGVDPKAISEMIDAMSDILIEVNEPHGNSVRVFCE